MVISQKSFERDVRNLDGVEIVPVSLRDSLDQRREEKQAFPVGVAALPGYNAVRH
jgi:hypothetical protein